LSPNTGGRARFGLEVRGRTPIPWVNSVSICVDEAEMQHQVEIRSDGSRWLIFETELKPAEETIVTLKTPAMFRPSEVYGNDDHRNLGIPVADMIIEPLQGG
jgi:hypothetical protein